MGCKINNPTDSLAIVFIEREEYFFSAKYKIPE